MPRRLLPTPSTRTTLTRLAALAALAALATLATLATLAAGATGCGREPTGLGATGSARLVFSEAFQTTGRDPGDDITVLRVTVYLVDPRAVVGTAARRKELRSYKFDPSDTKNVKDSDASVTITVEFPLQGSAETVYEVEGGAYYAAGTLLFAVQPVQFTEKQVSVGGGVTVGSTAVYVGPGTTATKIEISPRGINLKVGDAGQFTAKVSGPGGTVLTTAPIRWTLQNPAVAGFTNDRTGAIRANVKGSTTVFATVDGSADVSDAVTVVVADVAPTGLQLVSGSGRSGPTGSQLPQAVVVRLVAGTIPVSGVAVTFLAGSGVSVSAGIVVTDANGQASVRWTLGAAAGSQTLTAASSGVANSVANLAVSATAVSRVKTVTFVSLTPSALTSGQTSTILMQVRDGSGAAVSGESVSFAASGTGNTFTPATTTTNSSGQATAVFSSTDPGVKTLTASIAGGSAQTSITVATNNAIVATQLVKVSGGGQTVRIGLAFGAPIVVEARNAAGRAVAGAFVDFGTSTGTARHVTGADGRASILYSVSPLATPGTGNIAVTLFPNSAVAVVFTYTAIP